MQKRYLDSPEQVIDEILDKHRKANFALTLKAKGTFDSDK